jgi:hypothetical protein
MGEHPAKLLTLAARSLARGLLDTDTTPLHSLDALPLETALLVYEECKRFWGWPSARRATTTEVSHRTAQTGEAAEWASGWRAAPLCRRCRVLQGFARHCWRVRAVPRTISAAVPRLQYLTNLTHVEVVSTRLATYDSWWLAGLPHLSCLQLVDVADMTSAMLSPLLYGA